MHQSETKTCQNCKASFQIEPEDFVFYEKIQVPPPTFCPECREIRRISFRNERFLYKRQCDLCGESVVSTISPNKKYPMYCKKCWWSDKWDQKNYGREYDFSKPFFEQYKELLFSTPHIALRSSNTINSDWVNQESDAKNCYLNIGGHFNEDSAYNTYEVKSNNCYDNFWMFQGQFCYENIQCERCYKIAFSQECFDCQDVYFSYDCKSCQYCIGCAGLRNKQYYIFNQPHSKEEYFKFLEENKFSSYSAIKRLKEKARDILLSHPKRFALTLKSVNVSGDFIIESKNSYNCWYAEKLEDCKNIYLGLNLKDTYDISSFGWGELCYEAGHCGGVSNSKFFLYIFGGGGDVTARNSFNLEYCYATINSNNCFGCANMQKAEYCILNKQYTRQEYEELLPKIKKHMNEMPYVDRGGLIYKYGEFFPIELSPFGYNETTAQDYYPIERDKALAKGYNWEDYVGDSKYEFSDYVIPDDIRDVKDDILEKILKCEVSGKPYKIIPMELDFYRKMGLPIPRRAPLQRHKDRIAKLSPRILYNRKCQCSATHSSNHIYQNTIEHPHKSEPCPNTFETSYSPERQEIVYCEQCYNQEVA